MIIVEQGHLDVLDAVFGGASVLGPRGLRPKFVSSFAHQCNIINGGTVLVEDSFAPTGSPDKIAAIGF
jgi:hypothetical protein